MEHLYYSALDIACILSPLNLGIKEQDTLLNTIWLHDKAYLAPQYLTNKRTFKIDVKYWSDYLLDKSVLDAEYPIIQKDLETKGLSIEKDRVINTIDNLDLFFKSVRLRICYIDQRPYVKIKLKTLLKVYSYKRRSPKLMLHMNDCMHFYSLSAYYAGKTKCNIADARLEDMLIFRVDAR